MLQDAMMSFALLGAEWVMWLLWGLSLLCVGITLERLFVMLSSRTQSSLLAPPLNVFLKEGDLDTFKASIKDVQGVEARVIRAGLDLTDHGPQAVEKAMIGTATAERMRMERGLAVLATVGSNAPFIGLFGTVLGVIQAFHDLAAAQHEASEAVMAGIAEALVATGIGLAVAIPAVVLYNLFNRWVKSRMSRADSLADLVIAKLHPSTQDSHGR
jgi:biopolymer transport protein ExbB